MYLLRVRFTMNGSEYTSDRTGGIYARILDENFARVESSCRVSQPQEFELGIPQEPEGQDALMKYYDEREVLAVDSTFLKFFTFPLISGNLEHIFSSRDHMVITKGMSEKLFGNKEALNQQVKVGEGGYFTVAGVVEDPPETSSIRFSALVGFHIMEELGYPVNGYGGTMFYTFCKLTTPVGITEMDQAINQHVEENFDSDLESYLFMESFSRFHLHGESRGIIGVIVMVVMSLVILFIACINFINLTTAFASGRIKEIAIRKSAGASKRQLILQFMGETYLILLVALYLGLFIAEHLVPGISRVFNVGVPNDLGGFGYWLQLAGIFLFTGILAGLYPAVKIAGFDPMAFLAGKSPNNYRGGSRSRKVLVVVQFAFSVFFVLASIFIIRQYDYLKEADLGFNREEVIYIKTKGKVWDQYQLIKNDLATLPFVEAVTSGSEVPVKVNRGDIDWGEREGEHNKIARILWTDPDFLETFQIGLQEGEFYTRGRDSLNSRYVVVNRSLVDLMGWEDPVGMPFRIWDRDLTILGVTDNINFFPFNLEVFGNEALIYLYDDVQDFVFVRVLPGTTPDQVASIREIFQKYNPGYEFEHDFVSEFKYESLESADGNKLLFRLFSAVAIFIAAMGLIGLSLFNSSRRTKEVGDPEGHGCPYRDYPEAVAGRSL